MPVSVLEIMPVPTPASSKASSASTSVKPAMTLCFNPGESIGANCLLRVVCGHRFRIGIVGEGQNNLFFLRRGAGVCRGNRRDHAEGVDLFISSGGRIQRVK